MCESTGTHHLLFDFARDLCLWGGPGAISRSIELRGTRLILGRSASEVDLPLDHASISRQHLALFYGQYNNGTVTAEDLSSATGTRLNGSRLSRSGLNDGDKLEVGSNEISVYVLPANRTLIVG
jgi:pSer/pThr/pTyr-binding forkhead associated (FHA) protein